MLMTRDEVLSASRAHDPELRRPGVRHAAVFGSVARGEAGPDSDIDVLVRFDPEASVTLWDYAGLKRRVARMVGVGRHSIDVIEFDALGPLVRS